MSGARDEIGERNYDAEKGGADRRPTPSEPPQKRMKPVETPSGGSLYEKRYGVQENILPPSTFVPSSFGMFNILEHMDMSMYANKKFNARLLGWNPIVSRIYFSVLFIIRTMMCMLEARIPEPGMQRIVSEFFSIFPADKLMVPGPLVPIFQSLSVARYPMDHFGAITPRLPAWKDIDKTLGAVLGYPLCFFVPSIATLTAMFVSFTNSGIFVRDLVDGSGQAGPDLTQAHRARRYGKFLPGVSFAQNWTGARFRDIRESAYPFNVPIHLTTADTTSWTEYLLFDQGMTWFRRISDIMFQYSRWFEQSVPLSQISLTAGKIPLNLCRITETKEIDTAVYGRSDGNACFSLTVFVEQRSNGEDKAEANDAAYAQTCLRYDTEEAVVVDKETRLRRIFPLPPEVETAIVPATAGAPTPAETARIDARAAKLRDDPLEEPKIFEGPIWTLPPSGITVKINDVDFACHRDAVAKAFKTKETML